MESLQTHEEVPNGPEAPARARRLLDRLQSRIPEEVMVDARLVLSEIVTNSYKHAGKPHGALVQVTATHWDDRLRLEVIDRSIFDPTPETSQELRSAKWGLQIVDKLADEWGRISEGGVWVEFDTSKRARQQRGLPEGRPPTRALN
jgi:anti-sigma regulatory factor (Ser/Thr protein kinase)